MNKKKIEIAKKTLKLLEKYSWEKISIDKILNKKNTKEFNSKYQILSIINRYIDYELKKNMSNIENSSRKDMLFEVMMARFDILNTYRVSIKKLINYFTANPHIFIKLLPSFIESMILTSTIAGIKVNGIKGTVNIKIIFFIYLLTTNTWKIDESDSLEKTMTTLDKYINQIEKIIQKFE